MTGNKPNDTHSTGGIICPWCGAIHFDEGFDDQTDAEWTCDHCERVFYVTIESTRHYTASASKQEIGG